METALASASGGGKRGRDAGRLTIVLLISGFSVALTLASLKLLFVPMGWLGLDLNGDFVDDVTPGTAAAIAGVRVGDRLAPNTPFFVRQSVAFSNHFGRAEYSFDVVRNGHLRHIAAVATTPEPNLGPVGYAAFPIFSATVFVFVICAIVATFVLLSNPNRLTWSFYLFCIGGMVPWFGSLAIAQTTPMPFGFALQMVRVTLLSVGLFAGLDFALRFPSGKALGWRKAVAWVAPFFGGAYLAWWWLMWISAGTKYTAIDPFDWVDVIAKAAIAVLSIAAVVGTYLSSASTQRQRVKWAAIGISLGYVGIAGQEMLFRFGLFQGVLQFVTWCLVLAAFLAPLSVAYAIARHRVIDVRFVLTRGAGYLILSFVLAATLASTYWTTNSFLQQTHVAALIQLSFAILAGVILMRAYSWMDSGINRLFFSRHYTALQRLSSLSVGLSRAESLDELEKLVASEPSIALDLVAGGVYRHTPNGWYVQISTQREALPAQLRTDDPLIARMRTYAAPLRLSAPLLAKIGSSLREPSLALAVPLYVDGSLCSVVLYCAHSDGSDLDPQEVSAIVALQQPAELAFRTLVRRAERLAELAELIAKAPSNAAAEPYDYLSNQLMDSLPPHTREAVVACASIPAASMADIDNATEDQSGSRRIGECPPLSAVLRVCEAKTFDVHGVIARAIERRFPEQRRVMLGRCGRASAEIGDHARAAQLLRLAGLHSAAASELEAHLSQQNPQTLLRWTDDGREYAYDGLAAEVHPNSWIVHSSSRLFRESPRASLNEGHRVANVASEAASRAPLLAPWLAYLQAEAGELRAADEALGSLPTEFGPAFVLEFASVTRALLAGRLGNLSRCAGEVARMATTDLCRGLRSLIRAAHVERMQGDWNTERSSLDSAIETLHAARSRFVVWALAEAVTGAWLAGEEHARLRYTDALREAAMRYDAVSFHYFGATSSREVQPAGTESPRWLALAHLKAVCAAETWGEARDSATRALAAAADAEEPFLQVLAHLACAEFDENVRQEHFRHALRASRKVDSRALVAAVRAVISNEEQAGMLSSFVMKLRKDRDASEAPLVVEVTTGRVRRGRLVVALSERELAVVLAIARSQNATASAELADLIWPDLDDSAGSHAVQTCMHRLRQRLRDPGAVEKTAYGYRLRDGILVDLLEIENFTRGLHGDDKLDEFTALRLAALAKHLDLSRPAFMAGWEWFGQIERRIEEWWRFAQFQLANDALARNDFDRAVNLARSIILRDEFDEPAWELTIRALLEKGDRAAAQRELRRYREVTLRELNAEPPAHLYHLVESAPENKRRLHVVGD